MLPRRFVQTGARRLLPLLLLLALSLGALPAAGERLANPAAFDQIVYLPFSSFNPILSGKVTLNGAPVAGVQLELRRFNGATWSTQAVAASDSSGAYVFNAPSLNPGERYYVRYLNSTDASRLSFWGTKELQAYSANAGASLATFDIANVALASPANDAALSLPINFSWQMRSATPNDCYEFNLWDPIDDVVYYTYPPLGHVGNFVLYNPPYVYQWYGWWVGIYANGAEYAVTDAYGESFYFRWVYIWPSAAGADQVTVVETVPFAQMLPALTDPVTDRPTRPPVSPVNGLSDR